MSLHNMLHLRVRGQSISPSLSLLLLLAELHENSLSQSALKMALQVCICTILSLYPEIHNFFTRAVAPGDYGAVTNQIITFAEGQMRATHTIIINQDDDCENDPNENFFSNIAFNSGTQPISVIRPRAEVIIDDSAEPECSKRNTQYCHIHYLLFMH